MDLRRINVKFYVTDPDAVALDAFIPVFHGWIRDHKVGGVLVDVADYSHVRGGPGVCLIGHEADYYMDASEGPLGLLYNGKRPGEGDAASLLHGAFFGALSACRTLEQEPSLKGKLSFNAARACVLINDRLTAPNREETFEALRPVLDPFLADLYGADVDLTFAGDDPRDRFRVDIACDGAADVASLLERLAS